MRRTTSSVVASSTPAASQGAPPDGMAQPGAQGDDQLEGAGDAEDHADPVAVEPAVAAP